MTEFVTVQTPDGPVRFPKGMSRADMAAALNDRTPPLQTTGGGTIGDMARSAASGLAVNATSLLDFPANIPGYIAQGGSFVGEKLGMIDPDKAAQFRADISEMSGLGGANAMARGNVPIVGDYRASGELLNYQPETLAGTFSKTAAGFAPSAVLGGTPLTMAAAGLTSEGAGQLTSGTKYETPARIAGAMLGPTVVNAGRRVASPFGGADPLRVELSDTARAAGIKTSAGQKVGSDLLRSAEGNVKPAFAQKEQLTAAAMKSMGSTAPRATKTALLEAQTRIVGAMDDAVKGVVVRVPKEAGLAAKEVARRYKVDAPSAFFTGRMANIAKQISKRANADSLYGVVSLEQLKTWRKNLGTHLTSSDGETRKAAHRLQEIIDEMTDASLTAAGRADDVAILAAERNNYRNFLAVQDAVKGAGAEKRVGLLAPDPLRSSAARVVGPKNATVGKGTDLTDIADAAAGTLETSATVNPGGVRGVQGAGTAATAGGGFVVGGVPGAAAGLVTPHLARGLLNAAPVQKYLGNQRFPPSQNIADERMAAALAGLLAQQPNQ